MRNAIVLTVMTLILAACGGKWETSFETRVPAELSSQWSLADVQVTVPDSLSVSNANSLAPNADIVWFGDPEGDRRAQVATVLDDGITAGASALKGGRPVVIAVSLIRFHAVTPAAIARAPGAVHNIAYTAQVNDAATGALLVAPQRIDADLPALVGAAAIIAAQQGQTQKVRIKTHLASTTQAWLGIGPDNRGTFSGVGR